MNITVLRTAEPERGSVGRMSLIATARGNEIRTVFQVVEASTLIPSNTLDGRINPLFPQELQPRDRTTKASVLQVEAMANSLAPKQLADSALANNGAPIVGEDMVVESGNGRTMAITKAYIEGKADEYKRYLISHAAEYGLSAEVIERMSQPVLVRVRQTLVDRAAFAKEANSPVAGGQKNMLESADVDYSRQLKIYADDDPKLFYEALESAKTHAELGRLLQEAALGGYTTVAKFLIGAGITDQVIDRYADKFTAMIRDDWKNAAERLAEQIGNYDIYGGANIEWRGAMDAFAKAVSHRFSAVKSDTALKALKLVNSKWGSEYLQTFDAILTAKKAGDNAAVRRLIAKRMALVQQLPMTRGSTDLKNESIAAQGFLEVGVSANQHGVSYSDILELMSGYNLSVRAQSQRPDSLEGGDATVSDATVTGEGIYLDGMREAEQTGRPLRLILSEGVFKKKEIKPLPSKLGFLDKGSTKKAINTATEQLQELQQVVGELPVSLENIAFQSSSRAYASESARFIMLSSKALDDTATWHEVGHHIEISYPAVKAAARAFLIKRAKGKPVRRLSSLYPRSNYRDDEFAIADNFKNHYTSKIYGKLPSSGDDMKASDIESTEIISMGFQYLYGELTGKAQGFGDDADFRSLMFGILKGLRDGKYGSITL